MTQRISMTATMVLGLASFGPPALAQTVLSGDYSVTGSLCVGTNCTGTESFTGADLKLKTLNPEFLFEDTSGNTAPSNDWRILTNENGGNNFIIEDVDGGSDVLVIEAGANANSLYVETFGRIGIGTSLPLEELHIFSSGSPSIRFDRGIADEYWDIRTNDAFWWVQGTSITGSTFPFVLEKDAPDNAFWMIENGDIGLGTNVPAAPLELSSENAFNFFRISATGSAVNESVDITFTGGPLGTGQLRYNIVDGDNQEMSLDADGNMVIDGTLTTAGPTCAGGCDRVFEADYTLPSITDYSERMYALGHLPAIGPTQPGQPLNVSEKLGQVINELEHAHIYISQQQALLQEQARDLSAQRQLIADLTARVDTIDN